MTVVEVADSVLEQVEREHANGITSAAILEFLASQQIRFSEATLRKWVQLGLLPRSVRVGRKGKHQGSKGLYPIRVIRQILRIKQMMAGDLTIEEIKEQFLFVRGDIEQLEQTLSEIFSVLTRVSQQRSATQIGVKAVTADLNRAQSLARELVAKLEKIEQRLSAQSSSDDSEVAAS